MRILIAIPKTAIPAAGPAYVAATLRAAGHQVTGLVFAGEAELYLKLQGVDLLMTGGLSCSWQPIERILRTAHGYGIPTVLGGGIVSAEPELVTRALRPSYSVIGQGELTAMELADGAPAGSIDGLAWMEGDNFRKNRPRADLTDLDGEPYPAYELFGYREALDRMKPSTIEHLSLDDYPRDYALVASRSCPYHCTFCWHTSGDKYRRRSVDSVLSELEEVVPRYRINTISILDELFGCSEPWLNEFCGRMVDFRKRYPVKWWCQLRARQATEALLSRMKAAGCYVVAYGFESYSSEVLRSMDKRIEPADIERAYRLTHQAGLGMIAQFIFGDPAETPETIEKTLGFWWGRKDVTLSGMWCCPDSPNYQLAVSRGLIKDRLAHQKDIFRLLNLTGMSDLRWRRFMVRLLKLNALAPWPAARLDGDGITTQCPHCAKIVHYGNFDLPKRGKLRVFCRSCMGRFCVSHNLYRLVMRFLGRMLPEWAWLYSLHHAAVRMRTRK